MSVSQFDSVVMTQVYNESDKIQKKDVSKRLDEILLVLLKVSVKSSGS